MDKLLKKLTTPTTPAGGTGFGKSLKAAVGVIIAAKSSSDDERRIDALKESIRLAAGDALRQSKQCTSNADEELTIAAISQRFFEILSLELQSQNELQRKLAKVEAELDFATSQIRRRDEISAQQQEELLREVQTANETVRQWVGRYNELVEHQRQPVATGATSFVKRGGGRLGSEPSFASSLADSEPTTPVTQAMPRLTDPKALQLKLEQEAADYCADPREKTVEEKLKLEMDHKVKEIQIRLKREQEVVVHRAMKRGEETLKSETAKLESKVRQLEQQLRRKEADGEMQLQKERERWRAQVQRAADSAKASMATKVWNLVRELEGARMEACDVHSQACDAIQTLHAKLADVMEHSGGRLEGSNMDSNHYTLSPPDRSADFSAWSGAVTSKRKSHTVAGLKGATMNPQNGASAHHSMELWAPTPNETSLAVPALASATKGVGGLLSATNNSQQGGVRRSMISFQAQQHDQPSSRSAANGNTQQGSKSLLVPSGSDSVGSLPAITEEATTPTYAAAAGRLSTVGGGKLAASAQRGATRRSLLGGSISATAAASRRSVIPSRGVNSAFESLDDREGRETLLEQMQRDLQFAILARDEAIAERDAIAEELKKDGRGDGTQIFERVQSQRHLHMSQQQRREEKQTMNSFVNSFIESLDNASGEWMDELLKDRNELMIQWNARARRQSVSAGRRDSSKSPLVQFSASAVPQHRGLVGEEGGDIITSIDGEPINRATPMATTTTTRRSSTTPVQYGEVPPYVHLDEDRLMLKSGSPFDDLLGEALKVTVVIPQSKTPHRPSSAKAQARPLSSSQSDAMVGVPLPADVSLSPPLAIKL